MKQKLIILFVLILSEGTLRAADGYSFLAKQNDFALQFGMVGLNDLSFKNVKGGVGVQYYILNNIALRGSLRSSYSSSKLQKTNPTDFQDFSSNLTGISFEPGIRFNVAAASSLVLFTGVQGSFSFDYLKSVGLNFKDISEETKQIGYGAGAFLGVEWFVFKNVSISGEYLINASWQEAKSNISSSTQSITKEQPNSFNLNLGNTGGQLIISFYF